MEKWVNNLSFIKLKIKLCEEKKNTKKHKATTTEQPF